jgi:hypothetical protein
MSEPPHAGVLLPVINAIQGYAFGGAVSPPMIRMSSPPLMFQLDIPQASNDTAALSQVLTIDNVGSLTSHNPIGLQGLLRE